MIRRENVRMYEFTESISAIRNREGEIKRLNSVSQVGINVREISGSNKINIQSHLSAETLFKSPEKSSSFDIEGQCHYFNFSFGRVFWLGPHEWLISTNNDPREIAAYYNDNFSNDIALSDVTDGYCELSLEGESLLKILKQAMTCDLKDFNLEEDTESNQCVQTNFAKMPVVFWKNSKLSVNLLVRRSYADYLIDWLLEIGSEDGCEILS